MGASAWREVPERKERGCVPGFVRDAGNRAERAGTQLGCTCKATPHAKGRRAVPRVLPPCHLDPHPRGSVGPGRPASVQGGVSHAGKVREHLTVTVEGVRGDFRAWQYAAGPERVAKS